MTDDDNPNGDYMDVCTNVLTAMCDKCPLHKVCMSADEDNFDMVNHNQMEMCMKMLADRLAGKFPEADQITPDPDGEATGCCEAVAGGIASTMCDKCPRLDVCMPHFHTDESMFMADVLNYNQMCICMNSVSDRLEGKYPEELGCPWIEVTHEVNRT